MVGSLLVLLLIVFAISRSQAVAQHKLVFTNQSFTPLVVPAIPLIRTGPVSNVTDATDRAVNAANQAGLRDYGIRPGLFSATPYAGLIFVPGSVDDRSLHSPSDTAEFPMRTVKPVLRLEPRKTTEGR